MNKWIPRFLAEACLVASRSKDPSTKCGAVIVNKQKRVAGQGYNGFPGRIVDKEEYLFDRDKKYSRTIHAEMNAILHAKQDLDGCTLYVWPMPPCDRCVPHIIESGVTKVVSVIPTKDQMSRWGASFQEAAKMFQEADIPLIMVDRAMVEKELIAVIQSLGYAKSFDESNCRPTIYRLEDVDGEEKD